MTTATRAPLVLDGLRLLARHGGVVEVRILQTTKGTVSGYFDDLDALAEAIAHWDGRATIYITANPCNPALLARARPDLISAINLGGIHHGPGRIERLRYVYLSTDEVNALQSLAREGVVITARDLPGARPVPLGELAV